MLERVYALVQQGEYEAALQVLEDATRLAPKESLLWHNKGVVLLYLGRDAEALAAFEESIRLDPQDAGPWNGKGNALSKLGHHTEALAAYEESIRLAPQDAFPWNSKGVLLRTRAELRSQCEDEPWDACLRRAVFLAWPPRSAEDCHILNGVVLVMGEDAGASLMLERLVVRTLAGMPLLTVERILRRVSIEVEVAHSVFAWLDDAACSLGSVERSRLRGQVRLRFGDPLLAYEILDALDSTDAGERDLATQLYLVWSMREFLEPHEGCLGIACDRARKWLDGRPWGPADETTCYYAGHIALAQGDLALARTAFDRAGLEPHVLLMAWYVASLSDDADAAAALDLLFEQERESLRKGRTGILFVSDLLPFDPRTSKGQEELQLVLRRFEVQGALAALLETEGLHAHPGYCGLSDEFREGGKEFVDPERHEHAVSTWRIGEGARQYVEQLRKEADRKAVESDIGTHGGDFALLGVAPPCSLTGDDLVEHLGQSIYERNLAGRGEGAMGAILSLSLQDRLAAADAVSLVMYAQIKAHYDEERTRVERAGRFAARTAMEAILVYLLRRSGVSATISTVSALGGWAVSQKLVDAVEAIRGEFHPGDGKEFPTFPDFRKHMHRWWDELGDVDEFGSVFGLAKE